MNAHVPLPPPWINPIHSLRRRREGSYTPANHHQLLLGLLSDKFTSTSLVPRCISEGKLTRLRPVGNRDSMMIQVKFPDPLNM